MQRIQKLSCALAAITFLATAVPALAEHTRNWRESDASDFEKGTAKGVALTSDGKLAPAPRFATFADPNLAYLWALRVDSKGQIYAAGGSNAKVVRLDEKGGITTVFESQEMAAQAITFDAAGNLYVGTSPDGKVYKLTPGGTSSVFFDPKAKYIWALATAADGTLFIGTGDAGEIFAVTPQGQGGLFYKNDQRHARALAFDDKGNLLVGTDPDGRIERIEVNRREKGAPPVGGAAFVIYETSRKEVTALATDSRGNIYAAAIGEKPRPVTAPLIVPTITPQTVTIQPSPAPQGQITATPQPQPAPTTFLPFPTTTGGGQVLRIAPDGLPEEVWSSREDLVYALGFSPGGHLLLGTGNNGAIVELENNRVNRKIASTAAGQVTSLASGANGVIFAGTANPGKVFTLGPGLEGEGVFESDAFDARLYSEWGRLTWWGERAATDGQVSFYVRSGNTADPNENWSPWAGPYSSPGEKVGCPSARFAQWKAVFKGASAGRTIAWVNLSYLPRNVAPVVDGIAIQDPGVRVQGFPTSAPGPGTPQAAPLRFPPAAGIVVPQPQPTGRPGTKFEAPPQGFQQKEYQSVIWSAHDDNDDDLQFSIYYRGEGEQNWRLLKDKLDQKFYTWDTTTMPDGAYYLKIVASDAPSNPAADALTGELESDRFEVDNTPPTIAHLRAEPAGDEVRIRFEASDATSAIERTEYSLDSGDWLIVFPVGRLTDAPRENYEITLHGIAPGEHTLAVRAFDRFDNSAAAKVTFTVSK